MFVPHKAYEVSEWTLESCNTVFNKVFVVGFKLFANPVTFFVLNRHIKEPAVDGFCIAYFCLGAEVDVETSGNGFYRSLIGISILQEGLRR